MDKHRARPERGPGSGVRLALCSSPGTPPSGDVQPATANTAAAGEREGKLKGLESESTRRNRSLVLQACPHRRPEVFLQRHSAPHEKSMRPPRNVSTTLKKSGASQAPAHDLLHHLLFSSPRDSFSLASWLSTRAAAASSSGEGGNMRTRACGMYRPGKDAVRMMPARRIGPNSRPYCARGNDVNDESGASLEKRVRNARRSPRC